MILLKQSTSVVVTFGVFVDKTDGVSLETGLATAMDNATTGIRLSKNGAAYADRGDATAPAYDAMGEYRITLSTTDTGTLGVLRMVFEEAATTLPVWKDFMVVTANVYDSLVLGTDELTADVVQWLGTAAATPTTAGVPEVDVTYWNAVALATTNPLPNAAADAVGGLPISDAGGLDLDAKIGALTFTVANQVDSNAIAISGDTTAADNLELQYDTTGLIGDTFPSTQSQLSNIANVGSATHRPAASYTLTAGTQSANTYTSTEALDGTRHEHTDTAGAMELYYEFLIGAGVPSSVQITGYVTGGNDDLDVYGYDWVAAGWVQIGNIQGGGSTSNSVYSFDMFVDMVGTGANAGTVRIRLYKASGLTTALLAIDQTFIAFSQDAVSALDAVYFDSGASNTGTTSIDGVPGNPVSTEAAVNTLLAARNLHKVDVALESSITFATTHIDEIWEGIHWVLAQGGQNLSGSHFGGADISGVATASVDPVDYNKCTIGTCTLPQFHIEESDFNGTVTFGEAGSYIIGNSHSGIAGATTPILDTGAAIANVNLIISDWHNGIEIQNLNNTGTDLFSISGTGQIIYAASSSGAVNQRGRWKVTNTGGVTITYDDPSQNEIDTVADTNELQTDWADGGRLDVILDAVLAMLDDPRAEPGQGAPAVNADAMTKLDYLYKAWRNKIEQTATELSIYDDAGTTVDHKSTVSDDTTTATKGEIVTGA